MLLQAKIISVVANRSFKNFGHKRQPIPFVTTLWHGCLTFTFLGLGLNWDKISVWILGEEKNKSELDWDIEKS